MERFIIPKGKDFYFTIKVLEVESYVPQDMASLATATMTFLKSSDGTPVTNGVDNIVATGQKVSDRISIPTTVTETIPGVVSSVIDATDVGSYWSGASWVLGPTSNPVLTEIKATSTEAELSDGIIHYYWGTTTPTGGTYGDYYVDLNSWNATTLLYDVYRFQNEDGGQTAPGLMWRIAVTPLGAAWSAATRTSFGTTLIDETVFGHYAVILAPTPPPPVTSGGDWWIRTKETITDPVTNAVLTTEYRTANNYYNGLIKFFLPATLNVADANLGLLVERGEKVDSYYLKSLYFATIEITFDDPLIPPRFVKVDKIYITYAG